MAGLLHLRSVASVAALLLLGAPAAAAPHSYVITMDKLKFGAFPAVVHPGDRLTWVNRDMFRHTATASDRSFDLDLPPGGRGVSVVKGKGAVTVLCRYHPGMRGVLNVQ